MTIMTEEVATAIVDSATRLEVKASVALSLLIYSTIREIPLARDIPVRLKALSIETVKAIGRLK